MPGVWPRRSNHSSSGRKAGCGLKFGLRSVSFASSAPARVTGTDQHHRLVVVTLQLALMPAVPRAGDLQRGSEVIDFRHLSAPATRLKLVRAASSAAKEFLHLISLLFWCREEYTEELASNKAQHLRAVYRR